LQKWAAENWVKNGCPASILKIGISSYGYSYSMEDPKNVKPGAPITDISTTGEYSNIPGLLAHYEVSVSLC